MPSSMQVSTFIWYITEGKKNGEKNHIGNKTINSSLNLSGVLKNEFIHAPKIIKHPSPT